MQPVFVEDVAELAVATAQEKESVVIDAAGPDVYTFEKLVRLIAKVVGRKAKLVHVRPGLALFLCKCVGYAVKDVILTHDEVQGLMANLLVSESSPTGKMSLVDWLEQNADRVGTRYASELDRHFR